MKLLNPRTKMATPVNLTTSVKLESKETMRSPNMGANASGPKPWTKLTLVDAAMASVFHLVDQFLSSHQPTLISVT